MSPVAVYARRLAVLPRALAILELHPDGLPMADLAGELGVGPEDLREVFMAYYLADLVALDSLSLPVVEFVGPGSDWTDEGDVDDPSGGPGPVGPEWVRVLAPDPEHELGVDHLTAEQLGALYRAGTDLLALEPDNDTLAAALEAFATALEPADTGGDERRGATTAQQMHRAAEDRRRVEITYSRQWHPGTTTRTVEPYRVVRTRRGWEVDAGPPDDVAAVRTYLVSGIIDVRTTDETFELPADLDDLLAANRRPETVELVVPQESRWAVDRFAESSEVVADDEDDVALRAQLLPPVAQRLGLLLLCASPDAFVTAPDALRDAGVDAAHALLAHHEATAP
ncbi:MAG TPA: WYL domain-containing protein [Actinomycetes bacterium]|jgi:proteasome accessory factor C|nr:WYL domain-containing protein [Actinomycetes bacterium]